MNCIHYWLINQPSDQLSAGEQTQTYSTVHSHEAERHLHHVVCPLHVAHSRRPIESIKALRQQALRPGPVGRLWKSIDTDHITREANTISEIS